MSGPRESKLAAGTGHQNKMSLCKPLTVVSNPSVMIMKKKMMDQKEAPPMVATASGYTTKIRPTSDT